MPWPVAGEYGGAETPCFRWFSSGDDILFIHGPFSRRFGRIDSVKVVIRWGFTAIREVVSIARGIGRLRGGAARPEITLWNLMPSIVCPVNRSYPLYVSGAEGSMFRPRRLVSTTHTCIRSENDIVYL